MEILPFSDARYGRLLWVPIAALAVLVLADPALAADTGSELWPPQPVSALLCAF